MTKKSVAKINFFFHLIFDVFNLKILRIRFYFLNLFVLNQSEENTVVEEAMSSEECDGFIFALKDFLHWTFEFEQDRFVIIVCLINK